MREVRDLPNARVACNKCGFGVRVLGGYGGDGEAMMEEYVMMYGDWDRIWEDSSGTSLEKRMGDGSNSVERASASGESGVPGEERTSEKVGNVTI